jgi:methylthioribose-1-phosphate isomerase
VAAPGVRTLNPVFDVTPAGLIDALVTEKGVVERPDRAALAAHCAA